MPIQSDIPHRINDFDKILGFGCFDGFGPRFASLFDWLMCYASLSEGQHTSQCNHDSPIESNRVLRKVAVRLVRYINRAIFFLIYQTVQWLDNSFCYPLHGGRNDFGFNCMHFWISLLEGMSSANLRSTCHFFSFFWFCGQLQAWQPPICRLCSR